MSTLSIDSTFAALLVNTPLIIHLSLLLLGLVLAYVLRDFVMKLQVGQRGSGKKASFTGQVILACLHLETSVYI